MLRYLIDWLISLDTVFSQVPADLKALEKRVSILEFKLFKPNPLIVTLTGEKEMDRLVYSVNLPEVPELDVVAQRLTVSVGENVPKSFDYDVAVVKVDNAFIVNEGSEVTVSLSYVDNAGNVGQPSVLTFTAVDTIAPPQPGEFGVTVVREEFPVAPVDPEVPVEPQE